MTGPLLIVGAGGHGRVVADIAENCGWGPVAFLDQRDAVDGRVGPWSVVGRPDELDQFHDDYPNAIVAIGDNVARLEQHRSLLEKGFTVPLLVHPRATVSRYARLGPGTVAMAGTVVNYGAVCGEAVILNTGCTVDHDCSVGPGAHVSPGANLAGGADVGACTWVGIGATVRQKITIASNVVVGAGAVVVCDVDEGLTVVGNPARSVG